jgi:hypothetical protein
MTDDLTARLRAFADGNWANGTVNDICQEAADAIAALSRDLEDLRMSVIAFAAPHAVRYAEEFGLKPGELHPTHFYILERSGARMVDFRRAELSPVLSREQSEEPQ